MRSYISMHKFFSPKITKTFFLVNAVFVLPCSTAAYAPGSRDSRHAQPVVWMYLEPPTIIRPQFHLHRLHHLPPQPPPMLQQLPWPQMVSQNKKSLITNLHVQVFLLSSRRLHTAKLLTVMCCWCPQFTRINK